MSTTIAKAKAKKPAAPKQKKVNARDAILKLIAAKKEGAAS